MNTTKRQRRVRIPESPQSICDIGNESGRTDAANAERFIDRYEGKLLFVPQWQKWLSWDGKRWADDSGVGVKRAAKNYAKSLWGELAYAGQSCDREELGKLQTFIKQSNQASKIAAFIGLAESDPRVVTSVAELNSMPQLLNVRNGTVDLETGKLLPHNPEHRLTQLANVEFDPAAQCPTFLGMLELIFDGNRELMRYIQQLAGYSASGLTYEHLLLICYGGGENGKSTFWNALASILGDYSSAASQDLLLPVTQQHPTIIAGLYRKRFVTVAEVEQNRHLAESVAKTLTGGDKIQARRMREDYWEFDPTHKLWISTNHKPKITGRDGGIWRRIRLIPFTVQISKRTTPRPGLSNWLAVNEAAGILNWLVQGFRDWRANGFIEPEIVTSATRDYRDSEDTLGEFLRDHCIDDPRGVAPANELFEAYAKDGGKWSKTAFGRAMAERFQKSKPTSGQYRRQVIYHGIRFQTDSDENTENPEEIESCHQLSPVFPLTPKSLANSIVQTVELVPTSAKPVLFEDIDSEGGAAI